MAALFLVSTSKAPGQETEGDLAAAVRQLRAELKVAAPGKELPPTESLQIYLEGFSLAEGIRKSGASHFITKFSSGTHWLAAQVFAPPKPKGTVILSHGYFDHTGVWKRLIGCFLAEGWVVASFDYPGHGLSSGVPASIDDFGDYAAALGKFIAICQDQLPGPMHLVAHSMGSSPVLDHLLAGDDLPLDRVILLAPLVRSAAWKASGFGRAIASPMFDSVPRKFRRNSSDEEFLDFHRRDPLQVRTLPLDWVEAHRAWEKSLRTTESGSPHPLRIIQGTRDTTVDWKYNLPFLEKRFPNADTVRIDGARHQLQNESEPLRNKVFEAVKEWLERP